MALAEMVNLAKIVIHGTYQDGDFLDPTYLQEGQGATVP